MTLVECDMTYFEVCVQLILNRWLRVDVCYLLWSSVHSHVSTAYPAHSAAKHHVIAPQLVGKPVVGSLRKTHLWDLDKKLIKSFFDSYWQRSYKTTSTLRLEIRVKRFVTWKNPLGICTLIWKLFELEHRIRAVWIRLKIPVRMSCYWRI